MKSDNGTVGVSVTAEEGIRFFERILIRMDDARELYFWSGTEYYTVRVAEDKSQTGVVKPGGEQLVLIASTGQIELADADESKETPDSISADEMEEIVSNLETWREVIPVP